MIRKLKKYEKTCPEWLMKLSSDDIQKFSGDYFSEILKSSLVYPGSGKDWSPIRQMAGIVHSFLFFDYGHEVSLHDIQKEILNNIPVKSFSKARLVGISDIRELAFPRNNITINLPVHLLRQPLPDLPCRGFFSVYEIDINNRICLIYLKAEAIRTIAELYVSANISPSALALVEHGLGGNNFWNNFGEPYRWLIKNKFLNWPEFLIVGNNTYDFLKNTKYNEIAKDTAEESKYGDERFILKLHN